MTLVSPTQSNPNDEIKAASINDPVNQIAAVVNGGIDSTNISSVSGAKLQAGTTAASAMDTNANPETRMNETLGSFVASGGVWSTSATLSSTMTACVAYVEGKRVAVNAIASRAFTASKDTYVSIDVNGTVSYTEVANGAAKPSLPASSVWDYIVVSSGVAITAVYDLRKLPTPAGSWWEELGRTVLTAANDSLSVSFTPKKYLMVVASMSWTVGAVNAKMQFNGDTGNNYAYRVSRNGAADGTANSINNLALIATAAAERQSHVVYITNVTAREKVVLAYTNTEGATGAANIPNRNELVGKWTNAVSQISSVNIFNDGAGDFNLGADIIVLGHD